PVLHPRRRDPRRLQALPDQRTARDLRSSRHADPTDAAREAEPLRRSQATQMSVETKAAAAPTRAAFAAVLLDMLALGVIIPVLPKLVVEFRGGDTASASEIYGLFGTAWALMQFIFSPVLGGLSDRFGRRPVVLISALGLGLDCILMA